MGSKNQCFNGGFNRLTTDFSLMGKLQDESARFKGLLQLKMDG